MKRNILLLLILFPASLLAQKQITSISGSYQIPCFQFKQYDYTSFAQTPLKSYRISLVVSHQFRNKLGLVSQFSYHSDKITQTYKPYLTPLPYDVKTSFYTFEYLTYSQGINYAIKFRENLNFIIQANGRIDVPTKKQMSYERYDGFHSGTSDLPEKDDKNGLVFSGEFELALKYNFSQAMFLQIAPLYSYYDYAKKSAIDAQIRSVFSLELSLGYSI